MERALVLLEALASAPSPSHLSELAQATGLAKATVHRMLSALVGRGFAARADDGYTLGSRVFQLAADARHADRLQRLFMPFLLELHVRTRVTVSVGLLSGTQGGCTRVPSMTTRALLGRGKGYRRTAPPWASCCLPINRMQCG